MKKTTLILLFLVVVSVAVFAYIKNHPKPAVVTNVEKPAAEVPAPKPKPAPVSSLAEFDKPVTLKLLKKTTFTDGLVAILTVVDDSRCPAGKECFWAGQLSVAVELSGGKLKNPGEIHLGTEINPELDLDTYHIKLNSATESTATVTITNSK